MLDLLKEFYECCKKVNYNFIKRNDSLNLNSKKNIKSLIKSCDLHVVTMNDELKFNLYNTLKAINFIEFTNFDKWENHFFITFHKMNLVKTTVSNVIKSGSLYGCISEKCTNININKIEQITTSMSQFRYNLLFNYVYHVGKFVGLDLYRTIPIAQFTILYQLKNVNCKSRNEIYEFTLCVEKVKYSKNINEYIKDRCCEMENIFSKNSTLSLENAKLLNVKNLTEFFIIVEILQKSSKYMINLDKSSNYVAKNVIFVLYNMCRINSLMGKYDEYIKKCLFLPIDNIDALNFNQLDEVEFQLIYHIFQFPIIMQHQILNFHKNDLQKSEIVIKSHLTWNYLYELICKFSKFYRKVKILQSPFNEESRNQMHCRMFYCKATYQLACNILTFYGFSDLNVKNIVPIFLIFICIFGLCNYFEYTLGHFLSISVKHGGERRFKQFIHAQNDELLMSLGETANIDLSLSDQISSDVNLTVIVDNENLLQINKNVLLPANHSGDIDLKVYANNHTSGLVVISFSSEDQEVSQLLYKVRISVRIVHSFFFSILSNYLGWAFFFCWGFLYYPQLYRNYKRKSVEGLSLEFFLLNLTGIMCFFIFNCSFYFNDKVQLLYHVQHPKGIIPVKNTDIFVVLNLLLVNSCILFQFMMYGQTIQKFRKFFKLVALVWILIAFIFGFVILQYISVLTYLYALSSIKILTTLFKAIPQLYLNYQLKTTVGLSMTAIYLDFFGTVFCMFQLVIDAFNNDDVYAALGNPAKVYISIISCFYSILFIIQNVKYTKIKPILAF
ncbi:hypothetical protein A3Q56_04730 [Intoshia linei]|uniref:DALR anticodon binding domain-containing protein n=1 Tax=Intoshia linei TaxID=1819745 RepID=A0A177AZU2_9BILA|nr:hypothetical protein A3Q56_04730 [Intoshia linei]